MSGLVFCRCGHTGEEHRAGLGCSHVNASRKFAQAAPCACRRFELDVLLCDAEEFLAKQVNHIVRKEGIALERVDREDLTQVMRISLWRAAQKYDSRSHIRFGSYAAFEVYQDAIDELRSSRMFGRRGQHRLPNALPSLTDDDRSWHVDPIDPHDEQDLGDGRLARVIAELTGDPPDAGSVDLRWVESQGDREALQAARDRRFAAASSAESGAGCAGWAAGLDAVITTRGEAT